MRWEKCRVCGKIYPENRRGVHLDRCPRCRMIDDEWTFGDYAIVVGFVAAIVVIAVVLSWWVLFR